jgi:hypothetical protein
LQRSACFSLRALELQLNAAVDGKLPAESKPIGCVLPGRS